MIGSCRNQPWLGAWLRRPDRRHIAPWHTPQAWPSPRRCAWWIYRRAAGAPRRATPTRLHHACRALPPWFNIEPPNIPLECFSGYPQQFAAPEVNHLPHEPVRGRSRNAERRSQSIAERKAEAVMGSALSRALRSAFSLPDAEALLRVRNRAWHAWPDP
jgi:hypothetical protein